MRPTDSLGLHDLDGSGRAVLSSDLAEEMGCSFLIAVTKILDGDDLLGAANGGGRISSACVRGFHPSAREGHDRVTHFTLCCARRQRSWLSASFLPLLPLKPPTHGYIPTLCTFRVCLPLSVTHPWWDRHRHTQSVLNKCNFKKEEEILGVKKSGLLLLLGESLHVVNGCWGRENQSFPGVSPLFGFSIPSGPPETRRSRSNIECAQRIVFIYTYLGTYVTNTAEEGKEERSRIWEGVGGTQKELEGEEQRWKWCKYSIHFQKKIKSKREGTKTMFIFWVCAPIYWALNSCHGGSWGLIGAEQRMLTWRSLWYSQASDNIASPC